MSRRRLTPGQVAEFGQRWVAGESIPILALEARVPVSTLYGRIVQAGYEITPEERTRRKATANPGGPRVLGSDHTAFRPLADDPLLDRLRAVHGQ